MLSRMSVARCCCAVEEEVVTESLLIGPGNFLTTDSDQYNPSRVSISSSAIGRQLGDADLDGTWESLNRICCGYRLGPVAVPQGATVQSATWTLTFASTWVNAKATWRGEFFLADIADGLTWPLFDGDWNAHPLTSASVPWTVSTVPPGSPWTAPDLSAPFQEVINRGDWSSGNRMLLIWKDNLSDINLPPQPNSDQNLALMGTPSNIDFDLVVQW